VAVVGTGNIARLHVEALRDLDARVVAGIDVDPDRVADFCARHGVPHAGTDLTRMLAEVRPDLVHVCTPPGAHLEPALAALAGGASVLLEKPPTLNLRDLDALDAAQGPRERSERQHHGPGAGPASGEERSDGGEAGPQRPRGPRERSERQHHGPWVATVFQHRFGSGVTRLRSMLDTGQLGRPLVAVCHTTWFRPQEYFDVPWRGRWETEGGGPTMGHGIHQMDLMLAVLGDWVEVSAIARRQARRVATEDVSLAHVVFANGAVASVVNSVLSPREESYLRFDFERATVEVTHLYGYGDDDWRITPAPGHETDVLTAWKAGDRGRPSGHRAQFAEVLRALRDGRPPPVDITQTRRTMRLVAGIYAAASTRCPVTPAELDAGSPFYQRMCGSDPLWTVEGQ
jgi:predicted dehydrogenase